MKDFSGPSNKVNNLDTTVVPFVDEKGKPYRYLAIKFDITEHKHAEEALGCSEAKNRSLVNAIPDLMFRLNKEGIFLDYYPAGTGSAEQDSPKACPL